METKLQNELNVAKKEVETNPSDYNATLLDAAQKQLESFYEEKTKELLCVHAPHDTNKVRRVQNTS